MFNIFNIFSKDESSNWQPSYKIPLWFNCQTASLNNVKIGDSAENLRAFGRPNNKLPFKDEKFEYYQLGFDVETENGKISNFCFMFNGTPEPTFANCELSLTTNNGGQLSLNRYTKIDYIEQILGVAPNKNFDEDEGFCYDSFYRFGDLQVSFFWLEDGSLEELIVEKYQD